MFAVDAYETKQAIRKGLDSMEFSSLPAVMKTAQDLTRKAESLTNYELASLISKDPFALAKVMDQANRGSSHGKIAVSKLEDAILKVGFRKVRTWRFLYLIWKRLRCLRYQEQAETAGFALASCFISERIMAEAGRLDPQQVYTVTVLRSYGKQLMTAFMIHYYREAVAQMPEHDNEDCCFMLYLGLHRLT